MARGSFVAIEVDGVTEIHAESPDGTYATLCGVDGDDPKIGQRAASLPFSPTITCKSCQRIISLARRYKITWEA
jgi:hypothetical protein